MKDRIVKLGWFSCGVMMGFTAITMAKASIPKHGHVTDDTLIYENLSEIKAARQRELNFDGELAKLSAAERYYKEHLPGDRQAPGRIAPVARVAPKMSAPVSARRAVRPVAHIVAPKKRVRPKSGS